MSYNDSTFRVTKSLLMETGVSPQMFNRVFETTVRDDSIIDEFVELTDNGTVLDEVNLAGLAGRVVRPRAQHSGKITIENGFAERRVLFMIAVESTSRMSRNPKTTILSGYTDRIDITFEDTLAPDLRFYINAISQVNNMGRARAVDMSHVISHNAYEAFEIDRSRDRHGYRTRGIELLRPMDVIHSISTLDDDPGIVNIDTNNKLTSSRNLSSRRTNGMSSRYLSTIINSVVSAESENIFDSNISSSRYARARSSEGVKESNLIYDPVAAELKGYSSFLRDGYIEWQDLKEILPNLERQSDYMFFKSNPQAQHSESMALNSSTWDYADQVTVAATIIAQSMGAILTSCLITYVECEFTNENLDGRTTVDIQNLASFGDYVDAREQQKKIEFIIINELMPALTFNGEFDIAVKLTYDLQMDALISISWDGDDWVDFTQPNYCDGLLSPVITTDPDALNSMAQQTGALIDEILNGGGRN